jgi:hypothetical protein
MRSFSESSYWYRRNSRSVKGPLIPLISNVRILLERFSAYLGSDLDSMPLRQHPWDPFHQMDAITSASH